MNKQKVPKLRFPEFTGEWEEKKLGEISKNINYGMNSASKEYDGKNKYIRITDINDENNRFIPNPLTSPLEIVDERFKLKKNDLLFARTGASTGKTYLYKEEDGNIFFAGFLIKFEIKNKYNSKFVFYNTLKNNYKKWVKIMSFRSGQPGINAEEYKILKIKFPSLPEQEKIADFLTLFDKEIELEEKKLDLLKENKKGYMQKIFNRDLRFKDEFGNDYPQWEEKRLGEVFNITRGYVLSKNELKSEAEKDYIYPVYSSQTKNGGVMGYYKNFLYEDSITWTTDGANAGIVNYRKGKFYCTNVCGVLLSKKGYSNKCIAEILNKKTKNYVSYVGNPKLMNGIVAQIKIPFPSLPEQEKIANFLSMADEEIELMENKIEKLKEIKKGLLQQMFI